MKPTTCILFSLLLLSGACGEDATRVTDDGATFDDAASGDEAPADDAGADAEDAAPPDDAAEDVPAEIPGDVPDDVAVDAADVPTDAAEDAPLDGGCDPALETRAPGGMCDGRGIIACNNWAAENGGPDASAVCLAVPGGGCARATVCDDTSDPATCRCGTLPACAPGKACVTIGGTSACVCAGPAGP